MFTSWFFDAMTDIVLSVPPFIRVTIAALLLLAIISLLLLIVATVPYTIIFVVRGTLRARSNRINNSYRMSAIEANELIMREYRVEYLHLYPRYKKKDARLVLENCMRLRLEGSKNNGR